MSTLSGVIELMILGFLADEPLHGYELKQRANALRGYVHEVSDGTLYPAIARLKRAGYVEERGSETHGAAARKMLGVTPAGRERLREMLRDADGTWITDLTRYFVVLSFLSHLPDRNERETVLRRRYDFLTRPSSFFYRDGRPLWSHTVGDEYRSGVLVAASGMRRAELAWLRDELGIANDAGKEA